MRSRILMLSGAGLESHRHFVSFTLTAVEVLPLALSNVFSQQKALNDYRQNPLPTNGEQGAAPNAVGRWCSRVTRSPSGVGTAAASCSHGVDS